LRPNAKADTLLERRTQVARFRSRTTAEPTFSCRLSARFGPVFTAACAARASRASAT
jgi:hypothetical protein